MTEMNPSPIIQYLRENRMISEDDVDRMSKYESKTYMIKGLLKLFIEDKGVSLQQFRMRLIKTGQSRLLRNLTERGLEQSENDGDDMMKSYEGRCMLHLQSDCYVVANEFKENIYINIRNYCTKGSKKYPTKQGVCLTLSRWLALKTKKDDIDSKVRKGFKGQLMTEELIHLGGGVYVTLNQKYPTVNVGHLLDAGRCR